MFASLGDNITPPQQAFNWVADVYSSTEEIKARGQTIVGLMQEEVGHLGIFVSGKVAQKEYTQIVSVMKSIELLPPGLYGMEIHGAQGGRQGGLRSEFHEFRLEEIVAPAEPPPAPRREAFRGGRRRFGIQPARVRALRRSPSFRRRRTSSPPTRSAASIPCACSAGRCRISIPWLAWLPGAAQAVKENRQALPADNPLRRAEASLVDLASATLEYQRALRDAITEALFFHVYGNLFSLYIADREPARRAARSTDPRELPIVKEALASIDKGGYPEAFARVGFLVTRRGDVPLSRLEAGQQMVKDYKEFLPAVPLEQMRRVAGEQEIIATYEPDKAIATLPALLPQRKDRERLLTLLERLENDPRVRHDGLTPEQQTMLQRVRQVLRVPARAKAAAPVL